MPQSAIAELTTEEASVGFIEAVIANEEQWAFRPTLIRAVILPIRPGVRMIKMDWISGIAYQMRVFGEHAITASFGRLPSQWIPVSDPVPTPQLALAVAQGRFPMSITGPAPEVNEARSYLTLHCPKCEENFGVQADHLPLNYVATCPHCRQQSPISNCRSVF